MITAFLLGVVATTSLIAGIFFLRFWRDTHDLLFLAFAIAFLIEAADRTAMLFAEHPNEASPWVYVVRLAAFLIILGGIIHKNRGVAK